MAELKFPNGTFVRSGVGICPPWSGLCFALANCPDSLVAELAPGCYAAGVAKSAGITSGTEAAGPILCLKMLFCFAPCAYADLRNEIVDKLGMDQGEKITCCQAQPCCAGGGCCACGPTMFLSCNLVALKKTITKAQKAAGGAPAMCIDDRGTEEAAAEEVTSQPGAAE